MSDAEWKAELNRRLGEPPPAPVGELGRILGRARRRERRGGLFAVSACALGMALAVVVIVAVKPPPDTLAPEGSLSLVTAAPSDGLDAYRSMLGLTRP